MNKILEAVYDKWTDTYLETYEMEEIYKMLIKPVEGDVQKEDRLHNAYAEALSKEQRNAFCAGFGSEL